MDKLFTNQQYQQLNTATRQLEKATYEDCAFIQCDFQATDISQFVFVGCTFTDCDFALSNIFDTAWREVSFVGCKLSGLHFNTSRKLGIDIRFESSIISNCVFYQLKMKQTQFKACRILECDFSEADLSGADFSESDLAGSVFEQSILEKANFISAFNFRIDPEKNKLKKASFAKINLAGLLTRHQLTLV
jgi:uncharacterized protein YjbI with pentapeptide repeats